MVVCVFCINLSGVSVAYNRTVCVRYTMLVSEEYVNAEKIIYMFTQGIAEDRECSRVHCVYELICSACYINEPPLY